MAIAVVYIGQRKFDVTSRSNHQDLLELMRLHHDINVYDFTRPTPCIDGPFTSSGGVQVWDFLQAVKQVKEDVVVKIRTDIWFTKNSMSVVLDELERIVNNTNDIAFMGIDFLNHYDKVHHREDAAVYKKNPDFVVIANRHSLDSEPVILERLHGPKHKSGNVMFKYIMLPDARAARVSCQMYLLRKDYDEPSNWQIYHDWCSEYRKSEAAQTWVLNNQALIGTF